MHTSEAIEYYILPFCGCRVHADTIIVTWMLIAAALCAGYLFRKKLSPVPGRLQSVAEMLIEYYHDLAFTMAGKKGKRYVPYVMSIFLFVLSCNWLGLFPSFLKYGHVQFSMPPTRDLSTTLALALISFAAFQYFGFREKGWRYILHYFYPIPLLVRSLPKFLLFLIPPLFVLFVFLNIVEEIARILSLSVRLMGNIMGEHIVASSLLGFVIIVMELAIIFTPIPDILPIFILFLGMLTGAIQAFIFSVLTLSYIAHAVETDEEH
ncbi:MAG: F0F1 ATP synthase subunit A [Candidatus Xenobiia bacterium LiM19]